MNIVTSCIIPDVQHMTLVTDSWQVVGCADCHRYHPMSGGIRVR